MEPKIVRWLEQLWALWAPVNRRGREWAASVGVRCVIWRHRCQFHMMMVMVMMMRMHMMAMTHQMCRRMSQHSVQRHLVPDWQVLRHYRLRRPGTRQTGINHPVFHYNRVWLNYWVFPPTDEAVVFLIIDFDDRFTYNRWEGAFRIYNMASRFMSAPDCCMPNWNERWTRIPRWNRVFNVVWRVGYHTSVDRTLILN